MTAISHGSPAYRRLTLAMLFAGFATFALLYAVQPLLPLFAREFGLSAEASSLAVSIATGPLAIGILAAGALSDRIGRRGLMVAAMFLAAALATATAFAPGWPALLALRCLTGIALAGVPAVAMAYVAEEVDPLAVGAAMGLYVAGSAIGGMAGRLGASLLTDAFGWRAALAIVGLASLMLAEAFRRLAPPSRGFVPRAASPRAMLAAIVALIRDAALPWLYLEAFLLMGAFVTLYNYVGFRLEAPPYGLGHAAVGAIFLLYILGSFSSAWFGALAGARGRRLVFWVPITILMIGIALTGARPLGWIVVGIGLATIGFFGAHSIAASWVGRRAMAARGQAAALYLFAYYAGSSVLGSAGGIAWTRAGWPGVVWFCAGLIALALLAAVRLFFVPPVPLAESPKESVPG
jgi:YNFM family putative membrane transporter